MIESLGSKKYTTWFSLLDMLMHVSGLLLEAFPISRIAIEITYQKYQNWCISQSVYCNARRTSYELFSYKVSTCILKHSTTRFKEVQNWNLW